MKKSINNKILYIAGAMVILLIVICISLTMCNKKDKGDKKKPNDKITISTEEDKDDESKEQSGEDLGQDDDSNELEVQADDKNSSDGMNYDDFVSGNGESDTGSSSGTGNQSQNQPITDDSEYEWGPLQ